MMKLANSNALTGLVALLPMLWPGAASAEIGPATTGLTASGHDASAVFFSPAAITRLDRPDLVIQSAVVYQESRFEVDASNVDGGDADNDERTLLVPGVFYVHPYGERWRLGLSLSVPSGIGNDYGKNWSGRYLAEESDLAFVAASAVAAYKFNDKWSAGFGPYVMYVSSKTKARVNNLLPGAGDGSVRLEEDGADVGLSLGLMHQFSEGTRVAASYRSSVKPKLEGTPSFSNLDPLLREALAAANLLGTEVDVDFKVPAQAQLGLYTEFTDKWSVTGDVMWVNMSEFGITRVSVGQDSIVIREDDFRDTYLTSVGAKYTYRPDHSVSFGTMYLPSPISDGNRQIALPIDRVFGVGVGLQRPCFGWTCSINLNYFDLGDGSLAESGGLVAGDIQGEFSKNWALMLDFQFRRRSSD